MVELGGVVVRQKGRGHAGDKGEGGRAHRPHLLRVNASEGLGFRVWGLGFRV